MQQSFCRAKEKNVIIDAGNTKSAVGNEVFAGSTEISLSGKRKWGISHNDSIVVRITKFLLMLTIVLAVTMTILNGIQYIVKSGMGEDPKAIQKNLIYVVLGIIIALFSVVIINLLRSTGQTLFNEVSSISTVDISSLI
jgi:hypothetical protein